MKRGVKRKLLNEERSQNIHYTTSNLIKHLEVNHLKEYDEFSGPATALK